MKKEKIQKMRIFLWGMMGSGKTTLASFIQQKTKLKYLDLDHIIESNLNTSIKEIFSLKGEDFFRIQERNLLHQTVEKNDNFVLATGGGTPCFFDNAEYMKNHGLTVYLDVPVKILVKRLKSQKEKRPLIANFEDEKELENFLNHLLEKRQVFYKKAHIIYDAYERPAGDLVEKLRIFLGCK